MTVKVDKSGSKNKAFMYTKEDMDAKFLMYDDLPPVPLLTARPSANAPTLAVFKGGIYQYTFDTTNDEVYGASEVIHRYKEGSDISIHVHWATNGVDVTERAVKWQLEYSIANGNGAFGNSVTVAVEKAIPANTADRKHFITGIGTIPGKDIKIGTYIAWRFRRIASTGTAPTADPFGLAIGFHVIQDTLGSRSLYEK